MAKYGEYTLRDEILYLSVIRVPLGVTGSVYIYD